MAVIEFGYSCNHVLFLQDMTKQEIKIIECPRDAMQGILEFISTDQKIRYMNALMKVGFHTLDFGSYVSPKAIPQMKDTTEVLQGLDTNSSATYLLAIVPNFKGALEAVKHNGIHYLGYPFSVSATFLKRNLNASIDEAYQRLQNIQRLCHEHQKQLVVYISMAFGNPYGEYWDLEILDRWIDKMQHDDVPVVSLSDTTGSGTPEEIEKTFAYLVSRYPDIEFGFHLHATEQSWENKLEAAYNAGCRRFDAVINDKGGCPMSGEALTANLNTFNLLSFMEKHNEGHQLDMGALKEASEIAREIFPER